MAASVSPTGSDARFVQIQSSEEIIRQRLEQERQRLEKEAGIVRRPVTHFHKPIERLFTRKDRETTTVLFGGLTWKHEKLVKGALENLGYLCDYIATPDKRAFQLGKEYGNNGQCNPTYFTVGNLVQHLQGLEESGMTKQEILDKFIFVTCGACGPCRFGMYEAEYRLALRNSGFDGFRVITFSQDGGLNQEKAELGLQLNVDFFIGMLTAFNTGDVLNDVAYQIRAFEVNAGETDKVVEEAAELLYQYLRTRKSESAARIEKRLSRVGIKGESGKVLSQLFADDYDQPLHEVRDRFNAIQIDRTRVKPIVKIIGEFWAQTTEGDGNFNMFRFLEKEGAQVLVEPIGTWINYLLHQVIQKVRDEKGLDEGAVAPPVWRLDKHLKINVSTSVKLAKLKVAEKIFRREYHRIVEALGGLAHHLCDQYELQRLAHPYYNSRAGGGEGHLEVAKNIYYYNKDLAHMVLALKPFGCMPSTQSDGAQSAVMSHYKDMIFLPIETSGEGDVNAHSRVQMALGEAKNKAKLEFKNALASTGHSIEEIRRFVDDHPEMKTPLYNVPHTKGLVSVAANFVRHAAERMKREVREAVAV